MIIQLPEWKNWRIEGAENDWRVKSLNKGKDGETWTPTNFFPSLDAALSFAYERTLRESKATAVEIREVLAECEKVKARLLRVAKKAVGA